MKSNFKKYMYLTRPRESFEKVRNQRRNPWNLRVRLTLMVCAELLVSALLAVGISYLLNLYLEMDLTLLLIVVLLVTSTIIGSVVTSLMSRWFFNPLKKLGRAMEQVADGDFSVRVEDRSSAKEVMEVYAGFNLMAHELGAMEMLQADFVSNVSHEFKTPINAIEGYSMLLQDTEHLDDEQARYVGKILFNTRRLSTLMGSILLLSKLENQQIPTKRTQYSLDEQIRQSIVAKEPEWSGKEIEWDVELDSVEYVGNEPMMRHVWDNLIGNAIKFAPQEGLIRMKLFEQEASIVFTIEDNGPGLSEEALKHMYDKFYQGDSSHKEEGNGLGLSLVKRILVLEQGEIRAENIDPDGCRFTIKIPKKE